MKESRQGNAGYLDYFPFAKKTREQIEHDVTELGFQQAAARIVNRVAENKLVVEGKDEEVEEILGSRPVIVIANHPSFAEIITTVASLEPRDDIYLIGISNFLGIGPNFSKHVIPVYGTNQTASEGYKLPIRIGDALRFGPKVQYENAHERNIRSIRNAAEIVNQGSLIVMFPEGIQSGKDKKWLNGIGYLVAGIEKRFSTYLIFAYPEGTSNTDYIRLIPGIRKLLPKTSVTFSSPRTIKDSLGDITDPRVVTKKIEDEYIAWTNSVVKKDKFTRINNP